jgi:uncharacterized protein YjaZ
MTKKEQREFVQGLCKSVADSIVQYEFPDHWDGRELRVLIAHEFEHEKRFDYSPGFERFERRVKREIVSLRKAGP